MALPAHFVLLMHFIHFGTYLVFEEAGLERLLEHHSAEVLLRLLDALVHLTALQYDNVMNY